MKINIFFTIFYLATICSCVDIYSSFLQEKEVREWALRYKKCIVVTFSSKEKYREADIKVVEANDFSGILYRNNTANSEEESEALFMLSSQCKDTVTNDLNMSNKAVKSEQNNEVQNEKSNSENMNNKCASPVLKNDKNLRSLDNKSKKTKSKPLNKKSNVQEIKNKKQSKNNSRSRKEEFNFEDFNKKYAHQDKLQLDQIKENERKRREQISMIAKKVFEDDKVKLISLLKEGNFKEASCLLEHHSSCPKESQCYEQFKIIFDENYSNSVTMQVDNISLIVAGKSNFNKEDLFVIYEYIKKMLSKKALNDDETRQKEKFKDIAEKIEKLKESSNILYSKKDIFK